jgi:lauroyl/myristoyl acyltransferase
MGKHHQGWRFQVMPKITKKAQRDILKDIRRQIRWIEEAIKNGDQDWIDQYSDQLSATAMSLNSENY